MLWDFLRHQPPLETLTTTLHVLRQFRAAGERQPWPWPSEEDVTFDLFEHVLAFLVEGQDLPDGVIQALLPQEPPITLTQRWCRTEDGRLVGEPETDAAYLYGTPGTAVPLSEIQAYVLPPGLQDDVDVARKRYKQACYEALTELESYRGDPLQAMSIGVEG